MQAMHHCPAPAHRLLTTALLVAATGFALPARGGPGSGSATILPADPVVAGESGSWVVQYVVSEPFDWPRGGRITVTIPADWSPPAPGPLVVPGLVEVVASRTDAIDSVSVADRTVTVHAGAAPGAALEVGDALLIVYGAQPPAGSARVQEIAPAQATFLMTSTPDAAFAGAPLDSGSPALEILPAVPERLVWDPNGWRLQGGVPQTIALRITDAFGNPAAAGADQLLSLTSSSATLRFWRGGVEIQQLVVPADSTALALSIVETTVGGPVTVRAADGDGYPPALIEATGQATTTPGPIASFGVSGIDDPTTAGTPSLVIVEALDDFGNRVVDFAGTIRFGASDPLAELPVDYTFQIGDAGLHYFPVGVALKTAGEQEVHVTEVGGAGATGAQAGITVTPASADALRVSGIQQPLIAGTLADVEVEALDAFGNRATDYGGTVRFVTSDPHPAAVVPSPYAFIPADAGHHLFIEGVRLASAGSQDVWAFDSINGLLAGGQLDIDVTAGAAAAAMWLPPGPVAITAGADRVVTLAVADLFGNPVADEPATIAILDQADGLLAVDPGNPGGSQGSTTAQSGATTTDGTFTVLYEAPVIAGSTDTLGAWTALVPAVTPVVYTTSAAGATGLVWTPAMAVSDTAGAAIPLTVEARDSFDNLDPDSASLVRVSGGSPTVRFSVDGGGSWSAGAADSLTLVGGSSGTRLYVRDTTAGAPILTVADPAGLLTGATFADLTITPALPAGVIAAGAVPDTLTADGLSVCTVTGGPIADGYGNPIAVALVTVSAPVGSVISPDEDPLTAGVQRGLGPDGRFTCEIRAAVAAATSFVALSTTTGAATGAVLIEYVTPVVLAIESVAPPTAAAGEIVTFSVGLRNLGEQDATLNGSTRLRFADPGGHLFEALVVEPVTLAPGGVTTVDFLPTALAPALAPARYTPLLAVHGADRYGSLIDTTLVAPLGSFAILSLELTSVLAPAAVSRGQEDVPVTVTVANHTDEQLGVTDLGLDFSAPAYQTLTIEPPLPAPLAPRAAQNFTLQVRVDPQATLGPVVVDAHATGWAGGLQLVAASATLPATWQVESAAELEAVPGSLGPAAATPGQLHPAGVVLANGGGATVVLEPASTRLEILDAAGGVMMTAGLLGATLVPGGESVALRFADLQLPPAMSPGRYAAGLVLGGAENGAPFAAGLALVDSLRVTEAAAPEVVEGSLTPLRVSHGQQRSFSLQIANFGGTDLLFETGTVLQVAGGALAVPLAAPVTIVAGGSGTLSLGPLPIAPSLPAGPHSLALEGQVREHGLPAQLTLPIVETLQVDTPALPVWIAGSLTPARATRGQSEVAFGLSVQNDGGAPLTVGLPGSLFRVSDGVDSLVVAYASAPVALGAGETAVIQFPPVTVPAALASQSYAPTIQLRVDEHGVTGDRLLGAPAGELRIESPALLAYVAGSLAPAVATPGDSVRFSVAVRNDGEATALLGAPTELRVAGVAAALDTLVSTRLIPGGTTASLHFVQVHLSGATTAGAHEAILGVTGRDLNGDPVEVDLTLGPAALLVIEDAAVRLVGTGTQAPGGHRVNLGQHFAVTVSIANLGEEAVEEVRVGLTGDAIEPLAPQLVGTIAGGDTARVQVPVIAVATPGPAALSVTVVGGQGAVSGQPVGVIPAVDDTLQLHLEHPARLAPALAITFPAGAADGIASSGSLLELALRVDNLGDARTTGEGRLRLEVPMGYGLLGPAEQHFTPGTPSTFAVTAPLGAAPLDSLVAVILSSPLDRNSGVAAVLDRARVALGLTVVEAARVAVLAAIDAPATALGGQVLPGQEVTIAARIERSGEADLVGPATLEILLDEDLALAPGEPATRAIAAGATAAWQVIAPTVPSVPRSVTVRLVTPPADENTGQPAAVTRAESVVGLVAQPSPFAVQAVPSVAGASPEVARGQAGIPALAFSLSHGGERGTSPVILLDALRPRLLDGTGTPIDAARVLATLDLHRLGGAEELLGRWSAGAAGGTPVVALDVPDTLHGGDTRAYVLMLSVGPAAAAGTFILELPATGGLVARDAASGAGLPIQFEAPLRSSALSLFEEPHNYPNPFAPGRERTRIAYVLDQPGAVEVAVFTLFGDRVWSRRYDAGLPGGSNGLNEVTWDGRNGQGDVVRNGVYLCRVHGAGLDVRWKIAVVR